MMTTGRDSQNFSNPDLFDPDRWDKKISEDNLAFTSLPFGFGPRMCYGKQITKLAQEMYSRERGPVNDNGPYFVLPWYMYMQSNTLYCIAGNFLGVQFSVELQNKHICVCTYWHNCVHL